MANWISQRMDSIWNRTVYQLGIDLNGFNSIPCFHRSLLHAPEGKLLFTDLTVFPITWMVPSDAATAPLPKIGMRTAAPSTRENHQLRIESPLVFYKLGSALVSKKRSSCDGILEWSIKNSWTWYITTWNNRHEKLQVLLSKRKRYIQWKKCLN